VAALIQRDTGVEPELVEGSRGEFSAWVGESRVAQKTAYGFPSDDEVVAAVRAALAAGSGNV
jgi:hypothetical protein